MNKNFYSKSELESAQKVNWKVLKKSTGKCSKSQLESVQKVNWKVFKKSTGKCSKSELENDQKVDNVTNNYSNIKM